MTDYILSIDQGTTHSRAKLFNRNGRSENSAQEEFLQHFSMMPRLNMPLMILGAQ
jgi:glycerol kinase